LGKSSVRIEQQHQTDGERRQTLHWARCALAVIVPLHRQLFRSVAHSQGSPTRAVEQAAKLEIRNRDSKKKKAGQREHSPGGHCGSSAGPDANRPWIPAPVKNPIQQDRTRRRTTGGMARDEVSQGAAVYGPATSIEQHLPAGLEVGAGDVTGSIGTPAGCVIAAAGFFFFFLLADNAQKEVRRSKGKRTRKRVQVRKKMEYAEQRDRKPPTRYRT